MPLAELEPLMQREIAAKMSDEKISFPQALKICKQTETESNRGNTTTSSIKSNRIVKKWISSFSSLLKKLDSFTLTEMQAVIEQIKCDRIDFSVLRRLSAECDEMLSTVDSDKPQNIALRTREELSESASAWRKNSPAVAALPLFQNSESAGDREL